jgi:hypothetical protein
MVRMSMMSRSSSGASTKAYSTRLASTVPAAPSRLAAVTDPTERRAASVCRRKDVFSGQCRPTLTSYGCGTLGDRTGHGTTPSGHGVVDSSD